MRVLLQDSHSIFDPNLGALRSYGGAPGEGAYIRALNDRIQPGLRARGVTVVRVPGDLVQHAVYSEDFDLFFTPHYDADVYNHAGGWFTDRERLSTTPSADDRFRAILERRYKALPGVPANISRSNANTYNFHAFRWTTTKTPGAIIELGVGAHVCNGHGFPTAPDHDWLRANSDAIAAVLVDSIAEFGGVTRAPADITTDPVYSVLGNSSVTAARLREFCPTAPAGVPELYAALAPQVGIRTDVAFAQAAKETGRFLFPGIAKLEWNNPAGLGVTGGQNVGNRFPDWETGIRAHLGHLLWYFGQHVPAFCDVDQRHFGGHKGLLNDIRQLNGRWAVPGERYGESIAEIAQVISWKGDEEVTREEFENYKAALQVQLEELEKRAVDTAVFEVARRINTPA